MPREPHQSSAPRPTQASLFEDASAESRARAVAVQAERQAVELAHERRRMLRGLVLLAIIVLLASLMHAGLGRVFYRGWWKQF